MRDDVRDDPAGMERHAQRKEHHQAPGHRRSRIPRSSMIQVPVAKGPSQPGGGPVVVGVLLSLVAGWLLFSGTKAHSPSNILWIAGGLVSLAFALQLLTPKK